MLTDYLSPVPDSILKNFSDEDLGQIGNNIQVHDEVNGIPDLTDVGIAIVGVLEDRGSNREHPSQSSPDLIRKDLYALYPGSWTKKTVDLGNIYKGETITDTYFAVSEVVAELVKKGIVVLILGGSQDITYANYRAYDQLEQTVNLTSIDSQFDLGKEGDGLHSESFLSHIVLQQPYNLFNYSNIGYQTYFVRQEELDLVDKMYFDGNRLGMVRNDVSLAEPILRDTDVVSFDLSALKSSELQRVEHPSPNGFLSDEACALTRYAGLSDKVSSMGLYNIFMKDDLYNPSSQLIAQMIWYFIEGVNSRKGDYPFCSKNEYIKFTVMMEDHDELIFYKSPKSERWWIEVPNVSSLSVRHELIPCSFKDYEQAKKGETPNRWWKAIQKAV